MKTLIANHRVIVCAGSGGVGKTTIAAALGVAAAKMGRRVLVLTIDPARRLSTTLGIARRHDDVRVPQQNFPGELWAGMIDPARVFDDYIERYTENRTIADRIFGNALYRQLTTTLSGSQEFTSLSRLRDAAESGRYDLIILDTPPAAHAMDFLHAPERLNALFDSTLISLFMGRAAGLGFAARAWKQSVKLSLAALTLLTGSEFVGNLSNFFTAIDTVAPAIRETNLSAHRLLLDPATAFVLITSYDIAKIQEGEAFYEELTAAGYHLRKVIVNRAWPNWAKDNLAMRHAIDEQLMRLDNANLAKLHAKLCSYYDLRNTAHSHLPEILNVPEMEDDPIGLVALKKLAEHLCSPAVTTPTRRGVVE